MVRAYKELYKQGETGEKDLVIDTSVSMIRLEVTGGGTLTAKGLLDRNSTAYDLAGIKVSDYTKVTSLTQGMYIFEVSGLYKIRFNLTGEAVVNLKLIV